MKEIPSQRLRRLLVFLWPLVVLVIVPFIAVYILGIERVSTWISRYNLIAFFLILTVLNVVVQPISPDLLIISAPVLLADSSVHTVAALAGLSGLTSGAVAYTLGRAWGERGLKSVFEEKTLNRGKTLCAKYGVWAVAITAVTPIPFSAICWLCGAYSMRRDHFLIAVATTRSTRHVIVAYFGESMISWLKSF